MTRLKRLCAALVAFSGLVAVGATAQGARNWTTAGTATPTLGHRIGNPAAKVKLTEYISYTCPHCAAFTREGEGPSAGLCRHDRFAQVRRPADGHAVGAFRKLEILNHPNTTDKVEIRLRSSNGARG